MSFFDDEGDEPPTRASRPRRPSGARPQTTGTRARATAPSDPQQLMARRGAALLGGAIVLILIIFGINGCLDARTKNALKDYNRNVSAIAQDSDGQVAKRLFELLSAGGGSTIGLQQNVNQVRVTADEDVRRARALSVPSDMEEAQRHLLLALTLRAGGVAKIAELLPDISGSNRRAAVASITGQMQAFLTSDVVYSQRVVPLIKEALEDHDVTGQSISSSKFLPGLSWLNTATVGERLGVQGAGRSGTVTPGAHGHGLTSVKIGDVTLQPQPAVTRVPATASTVFTVDFQNQGENDEFDVTVRVGIRGTGSPINVQKRVDQTKAGQAAQVQIALGTTPPIGASTRVTVSVGKVPGERTMDNNSQTYTVIFTR